MCVHMYLVSTLVVFQSHRLYRSCGLIPHGQYVLVCRWSLNACGTQLLLTRLPAGKVTEAQTVTVCLFFLFSMFGRPSSSGHPRTPSWLQDGVCGGSPGERHGAAHRGDLRPMRGNHRHPQEQKELLPHPIRRGVHRGQGPVPLW